MSSWTICRMEKCSLTGRCCRAASPICSTTAANTARVTLRFLRISLTIPFLFPFRMKAPAWRDRSLRKFLSLATAPIPRGRIPRRRGIGLAVVKRAAEQMHGSVKAENLDGGGLCVTITLPRTQEG